MPHTSTIDELELVSQVRRGSLWVLCTTRRLASIDGAYLTRHFQDQGLRRLDRVAVTANCAGTPELGELIVMDVDRVGNISVAEIARYEVKTHDEKAA